MRVEYPFGIWAPDQVGAPLRQIFNVLPAPDGWKPFPFPTHAGVGGLPHEPLFLEAVRSASGIDYTLTGDTSRVYRADATSWVPYAGNFNVETPWQVAPYGDFVYLVNGRDPILKLDLNGSLGPEPVPDLPNGLGARYIAQVADVIMTAWTVEDEFNQRPFRTQWSGVGRPDRYTPSTAIQADFQDHTDIGELRGLAGGEYCLIHGAHGMIRGDYVGPPDIFQFRTLETDVGIEYPGSLAWSSGRGFWWSRSGFRFSNGGPSQAIGFGLVDEFFRRRLRSDFAHRITAKIFPEWNCYLISYPGASGFTGKPSETLAYDYLLNRWGFAEMEVQVLGRGLAADRFTDDPAIGDLITDELEGNTDDASGSASFPATIEGGNLRRLRILSTTRCELELAERALVPGRRARVTRVYPMVEADPVNMRLRIYTRERQDSNEFAAVSPDLFREDTGSIACDDAGMLHRFSLRWNGIWTKARGLAVEFNVQGVR